MWQRSDRGFFQNIFKVKRALFENCKGYWYNAPATNGRWQRLNTFKFKFDCTINTYSALTLCNMPAC